MTESPPDSSGEDGQSPKSEASPTTANAVTGRRPASRAAAEFRRLSPLQKLLAAGGLLGALVAVVQLGFWTRDAATTVLDTATSDAVAREARELNPRLSPDDIARLIEALNATKTQGYEKGGQEKKRAGDAIAAARQGNFRQAEKILRNIYDDGRQAESAARKDQASAARSLAAVVHVNNAAEALYWYREAATLDPDDFETWRDLTRAELKAGTVAAAQTAAEHCYGLADTDRLRLIAATLLGDVLMAREDLDGALPYFAESHDIARRLFAQDSDDPDRLRDVSVSAVKIGDLLQRRDDPDGALRHYEEALVIVQQRYAEDRGSVQRARDLSKLLDRLGDTRRALRQSETALQHYDEALTIKRRLHSQDPQSPEPARELVVTLSRIGNMKISRGDGEGAFQAFEESLEISRQLYAQDPGDARRAHDLSVMLIKIGDLQLADNDIDPALRQFSESLKIRRELQAQDPDNTRRASDLSASLDKVGDALLARRDNDGALHAYREGLEIRRSLYARNGNSFDGARDVFVSLTKVGTTFESRGDTQDACSTYREASKLVEILQARWPSAGLLSADQKWVSTQLEAANCEG